MNESPGQNTPAPRVPAAAGAAVPPVASGPGAPVPGNGGAPAGESARARNEEGGLNLKPSGRMHSAASVRGARRRADRKTSVDNPVFSCRDVSVFYGAKQALKSVSIDVGRRQVLAMIGPSGCGKSTFLRCLNRMNDTIPGARVTGSIKLDGRDIHGPGQDVVQLRARIGMVFQKPNPFPEVDLRQRRLRPAHPWPGAQPRAARRHRVHAACTRAGLWDEVKDRLSAPRHRTVRRPAAAPVHRAHHRRAAGGDPHGRAVLGARSDRHRAHRGPDR